MPAKKLIGRVVSNKMNHGAVVLVETTKSHPIYRKMVKSSKKYLVHDPLGVAIDDTVAIKETKPLSRRKRFVIIDRLEK